MEMRKGLGRTYSRAWKDKEKFGVEELYGNTAQKSRRDTARSDIIRPWINR